MKKQIILDLRGIVANFISISNQFSLLNSERSFWSSLVESGCDEVHFLFN